MTLRFGGIFADAGTLWRAEAGLLARVAGPFFFLPVFGFSLFVAPIDPGQVQDEALWSAIGDWYAANAPWIVLVMLMQLVGAATMLGLLLLPERPTVGAAIARSLRMLPSLLVGLVGTGLLVGVGMLAFLVPGLYAVGRCFLVIPVLVAEPERGAFGGFAAALRRTHGRGWLLLLVNLTVWVPAYLAGSIFGAAAEQAGPVGAAIGFALVALAGAAGGIAQAVVQAAAYRGLAGASQGI